MPKPGTPLYIVHAYLPAIESFGFETDLRCVSILLLLLLVLLLRLELLAQCIWTSAITMEAGIHSFAFMFLFAILVYVTV